MISQYEQYLETLQNPDRCSGGRQTVPGASPPPGLPSANRAMESWEMSRTAEENVPTGTTLFPNACISSPEGTLYCKVQPLMSAASDVLEGWNISGQ